MMGRTAVRWSLGLGLTVVLLAAAAWSAWRFVVNRLAANARAPHLVLAGNAPPAPDLSFRDLDGTPRRLSDYKGKVVVLDLWGTWCIQCVAEMPSTQALYRHYQAQPDVQFLIVSRLDTPAKVQAYARRNRFTLPFFVTNDSAIPPSMQLHQFPSAFVIDRSGFLVAEHAGAADWAAPSVMQFLDTLRHRQPL